MSTAVELAQKHWNDTPLYYSEAYRYSMYPWLHEAAEFDGHCGERVLEIGCGTGSDLLQFARSGACAVGIDIADGQIELARERVGNAATVIKATATDLPFEDRSFDYVYSHGVLHHIDNPQRVVREIMRVLVPGGHFSVHVYSLFSYAALRARLRYGGRWRLYVENSTAPVRIDLYTKFSLCRLFPVPITVTKREAPFLEKWFGWFLIVKGQRPGSALSRPRPA